MSSIPELLLVLAGDITAERAARGVGARWLRRLIWVGLACAAAALAQAFSA